MPETDLGRVAVSRLRDLLRVDSAWTTDARGFTWSCWGVDQHVWYETSRDRANRPVWRLQLRTLALDGFCASDAQVQTLSSNGCPALAGVVRHPVRPDALELGIGLEIHAGNLDWAVRLLDVAARVQATETHIMSLSGEFANAGLTPQASIEQWTCPLMKPGGFPVDDPAEAGHPAWSDSAIDDYVGLLRTLGAHAVRTGTTVCATMRCPSGDDSRCILELTEREHPALGAGVFLVLMSSARDGLEGALRANARELSANDSAGLSLGGWWAAQGGLRRYSCFYPYALSREGVLQQLLVATVRRAAWVACQPDKE